jgi:hypothetical protein
MDELRLRDASLDDSVDWLQLTNGSRSGRGGALPSREDFTRANACRPRQGSSPASSFTNAAISFASGCDRRLEAFIFLISPYQLSRLE